MTAAALLVAVVALAAALVAGLNALALRRRLAGVPKDGDVVALLRTIDRDLHAVEETIGDLEERLERVEVALPRAISRTGVVLYDAFGDITGNLSRSIALLDARGTGIVISLLVGRAETLFFTKQVRDGRGVEPLSPEEGEAVAQALRGTIARP